MPSGDLLVSASRDKSIKLWEVLTGCARQPACRLILSLEVFAAACALLDCLIYYTFSLHLSVSEYFSLNLHFSISTSIIHKILILLAHASYFLLTT